MDYDRRRRPAAAAPSLKQRIRSSACFLCCFRGASDDGDTPRAEASSLIRVSSDWIRSRAHEIPELTDRMRVSLSSRMGRHRRAGSGGFRYDSLSYALNFDEGPAGDELGEEEEAWPRSFASRLPATPPPGPAPGAV